MIEGERMKLYELSLLRVEQLEVATRAAMMNVLSYSG